MVDSWNPLIDHGAIVKQMLHDLRFHEELGELSHQILQFDSHFGVILGIQTPIDLAEASSVDLLEQFKVSTDLYLHLL